jgi:hypothetical protein
MAVSSPYGNIQQLAEFETISRFVAALLNEGYVKATPTVCSTSVGATDGVLLHDVLRNGRDSGRVWIALSPTNTRRSKDDHTFHPADFGMPVVLFELQNSASNQGTSFGISRHDLNTLTSQLLGFPNLPTFAVLISLAARSSGSKLLSLDILLIQ